jgi:hypothetical protein
LIHPVLVVAPLAILNLRFRITGWPTSPPVWLSAVVALLALLDFVGTAIVERHFLREPTASRLRANGQIPDQSVALIGMVLMLAPVCWALGASFLGLSATQLGFYAATSILGVAFWGWRYRRVIYGY